MLRVNFHVQNLSDIITCMKNLFLMLLLAGTASMPLAAQEKINPAGRIMLHDYKLSRDLVVKPGHGDVAPLSATSGREPVINAVVLLREGYDSSVLASVNATVVSELNGVVVVSCPITECEKIALLPEVMNVGFGDEMRPMLDFARPSGKVNTVQEGFAFENENLAFDGTGVIAGMMDTGLEANHLNFRNDDGTSRIQRLWHMKGSDGSYQTYTSETVSQFGTDNSNGSHATHVAGILGGSYKGKGTFGYITTAAGGAGGIKKNEPIPYYGVATGADLAFSVGSLATPNIIQGVTNIIDYAESTGQPVVVNLSLGSTTGPHDGTDYYTRSLSRLGEKGIICIAAGNDGDSNISITKTLTASGNGAYLRSFPFSVNDYGQVVYGYSNGIVDLWTNSADPVTFAWKVFRGNAATATTIIETTAPGQTVGTSGNAVFNEYFSGSISMTSSVDSDNGRYNVYSSINVSPKSSTSNATLMLEVSGPEGTELYVFSNGLVFENKSSASGSTPIALTPGSPANSISDAACGKNLISVGAYTSRSTWRVLTGDVYQYSTTDYKVNGIAPFSSYGTSFAGEKLPLICAPGANIVSSISRYTVKNANQMTASAPSGLLTDYWGPMQGTSMACPFVSGVVALWLQACPTLTFDQVMDVINHTSEYNALTMKGGRWGAGKINALDGIKYVLQNYSAIGSVWEDDAQRFILTPAADGYDVTLAGEARFTVSLTDMQGRTVATAEGFDGAATVSTAALTQGIYVLTVQSPSTRLSRKIAVR